MDRFHAMRAFRAVVESHGFSRAASRLGRSATSISRSVADLERSLDVRLLHRTTRKVRLTDEGQLYYERCVRVLDELDSAELLMKGAHEVPAGTLRVTAAPAFGAMAVAPLLPAFHLAWPRVRVDLFLDDRVVDVIGEGFDLALRFVERRIDSSLVARRLVTIENRMVASPDYVAEHGSPSHPRELGQHAIIVWSLRSLPETLALD